MLSERLFYFFFGPLLLLSSTLPAASQTIVAVSPETDSVLAGGTRTLDILVTNVANLHGAHVRVTFDSSIVHVTEISRGSFLGDPVYFAVNPPPGQPTNSITVDQAILGIGGVTGSGVLFGMTYTAVRGGTSLLTPTEVTLRDSLNHQIAHSVRSGSVKVIQPLVNISISLGENWNMVSLPVGNPIPGDSMKQLFPSSLFPYGYEFDGMYVRRWRLQNGKGYWAKFPSTQSTQVVTGTRRTADSVDVVNGWNMIGSLTDSIETNSVVSQPPGLLAGAVWYSYSNSYQSATRIVPGRAYWVKCTGAGKVILSTH